jgi:hypothetical protein
VLPLFGVKFTVADGSDQRVDMIVGGGLDDHGRNLSAMGTDHPNVCYHTRFVWTSPLGQTYRTRGEPITPDLPQPLPRDPDPHPPGIPMTWDGPIFSQPQSPPPAHPPPTELPGQPPF